MCNTIAIRLLYWIPRAGQFLFCQGIHKGRAMPSLFCKHEINEVYEEGNISS